MMLLPDGLHAAQRANATGHPNGVALAPQEGPSGKHNHDAKHRVCVTRGARARALGALTYTIPDERLLSAYSPRRCGYAGPSGELTTASSSAFRSLGNRIRLRIPTSADVCGLRSPNIDSIGSIDPWENVKPK
jgi:hypothetical protein